MQDSNNIDLLNNYTIYYVINNKLDKKYNKNAIIPITFDREDELFVAEERSVERNLSSFYKVITFQYHKNPYDAFNIDKKRISISSNGVIIASE
jgi:hypothetical protein